MSGRETRAARDLTHLSVDQVLLLPRGRGHGSRSPSPAAGRSQNPGACFFPPQRAETAPEQDVEDSWADADEEVTMVNSQPIPEDASPAEVRKMAEAARQEAVALQQQNDRITKALETATAAAAAATAAINAIRDSGTLTNRANSIPSQARRKRPDLPAFDKNNIHIWIKRIEAAYAREDVIEPKQKFAFLESIIGTNMGPTINNFMFGESTQAKWNEFLQHLIDTFGPTKQQRCSTYLDGVKRDGRRPSDLLACIRDKGKDVTIDDLEKQLIWRELPSDVQKLLQDKLEGKTANETALLADQHFDQQGKPLNSSASINNVDNSYSCPTAPSDPLPPPSEG